MGSAFNAAPRRLISASPRVIRAARASCPISSRHTARWRWRSRSSRRRRAPAGRPWSGRCGSSWWRRRAGHAPRCPRPGPRTRPRWACPRPRRKDGEVSQPVVQLSGSSSRSTSSMVAGGLDPAAQREVHVREQRRHRTGEVPRHVGGDEEDGSLSDAASEARRGPDPGKESPSGTECSGPPRSPSAWPSSKHLLAVLEHAREGGAGRAEHPAR